MKDPEILDPDWSRYPDTVLRFEDGELIDLRREVGERETRALAAMGLSEPFAVVTAHDPLGEDLAGGENDRRSAQLLEALRSRKLQFIPVNACSPDGEHCEHSVAVKISLADARQLARDYGQVAFFWYDGEQFWIAGGVLDTAPVSLPRTL